MSPSPFALSLRFALAGGGLALGWGLALGTGGLPVARLLAGLKKKAYKYFFISFKGKHGCQTRMTHDEIKSTRTSHGLRARNNVQKPQASFKQNVLCVPYGGAL